MSTDLVIRKSTIVDFLPDKGEWTNRFKIKSETSDSLYTISQHKTKKHIGCSCPGWIIQKKDKNTGERLPRECKHLKALGLPKGEVPVNLHII